VLQEIVRRYPSAWKAWTRLAKCYLSLQQPRVAADALSDLYRRRRAAGLGFEYRKGFWFSAKLAFDLAQAQYLVSKGLVAEQCAERFPKVERLVGRGEKTQLGAFELSHRDIALLDGFYESIQYSPKGSRGPGPLCNELKAFDEVAGNFFESRHGLSVVDHFLPESIIRRLHRFCLQSTIWHELRPRGTYIGAYLDKGFCSPDLLEIASHLSFCLRKHEPACTLEHAWAYIYEADSPGINAHADFALVNVNLWLTASSANKAASAGGMTIYSYPVPHSWGFDKYNERPEWLRRWALRRGNGVSVPFRRNRCVLFDSRFVHHSDPIRFQDRFDKKRLNVTLLFGRRQHQVDVLGHASA
jgi:hypothetical protein